MTSIQSQKPSLIIPIELQIRELDAKLLLACLAATRGFNVFLGNQFDIHLEIGNLPVGTYLAKDITPQRFKVLSFIKSFGFRIFGWDEEVLVYYSQELYRKRRIYKPSMALFDGLFAWGNDSAAIWNMDNDTNVPVYITGNPRGDLLRSEFESFFEQDVSNIKKEYGDFVLFNSNFGSVNPFATLYKKLPVPGEKVILSKINQKNYVADLAIYKNALFQKFLEIIPQLANNFPKQRFVIRPHPAESHEPWIKISKDCANVCVVRDGNIVNWLKACKLVLHNGCTTSIEARIMNVPVISYNPLVDERFDPFLPTRLSLPTYSADELVSTLKSLIYANQNNSCLPYNTQKDFSEIIDNYITNPRGRLSSELILDEIQRHANGKQVKTCWLSKLKARMAYLKRKRQKLAAMRDVNSRYSDDMRKNDFPPLSFETIQKKIALLSRCLNGCFDTLEISLHKENIFNLSLRTDR